MSVVTSDASVTAEVRPLPTGEGLTFEKVWASMQETDRQMKENDRILTERFKATEKILEENARERKKTERYINKVSRQMGLLNNRFGELAEHLVAPSINKKFNEMGYHFDTVAPGGEKIFDEDGQVKAQVDLILRNSDYIVAVEVKAKPVDDDVPEHIERLEKLRAHWNKRGEKRVLRGAIAGAIFPESVKRAALKAGLYVIVQTGDTMKIDVPSDFMPREF